MLGETFEFVTDKFRYLTEKVQHIPTPAYANHFESESFKIETYAEHTMAFRFNSGRGMLAINEAGISDITNKKYNERYCFTKPTILAKNIIFGNLTIDFEG